MSSKKFIRFWLPMIPFLILLLALFGVVIAIDSKPISIETLTPVLIPTVSTTVISPTNNSAIPGTPSVSSALPVSTATPIMRITPAAANTSTITLEPISPKPNQNNDQNSALTIFKDAALILATGLVALLSAYIGALVQGLLKEEEENRSEKKNLIGGYRLYLENLWKMAQRFEKILTDRGLREKLPDHGKKYVITPETLQLLVDEMPLIGKFSVFEQETLRIAYDDAVNACIRYIIELQQGRIPESTSVIAKYKLAMVELAKYIHS